jgi:hypothetical protein
MIPPSRRRSLKDANKTGTNHHLLVEEMATTRDQEKAQGMRKEGTTVTWIEN